MGTAAATGRSLWKDYGLTVVLAVLVALAIRAFLIEAYRIPSPAMRPSLEPGDTIFVAKFPFGLRIPGTSVPFTSGRMPEIGEVVIYTQAGDPPRDSIRRVVALPGQNVQIQAGRVKVDGRELSEGVPKDKPCGEESAGTPARWTVCWEQPLLEDLAPTRVPEGSVFVLGDSRTQTPESRRVPQWEMVPVARIKGKALWIWLSIQPPLSGNPHPLFSRIRFERMFRRI